MQDEVPVQGNLQKLLQTVAPVGYCVDSTVAPPLFLVERLRLFLSFVLALY